MNVVDIHAHIYEQMVGITRGQLVSSTGLERVAIENEEVQFLPPSLEQSRSTAEMLIAYMDWCGTEKAILTPNPYYEYHNRYFVDNIQRYPNRLRGVTLADVAKGQETARELAPIYDQGILSGLKVEVDDIFQYAPGTRLIDSRLVPVWGCYNQYHQPIFIYMFRTGDTEDMGVLASAYPSIRFVLCHMGVDARFKKRISEFNYRQALDLIKNRPNVFIDTSTVPVYFNEEYSRSSPVGIIQVCYHHVGPEKVVWASDYPGMLNHGTIRQLINLVGEYCSHVPESHRQMIMVDGARRLFFDNQK